MSSNTAWGCCTCTERECSVASKACSLHVDFLPCLTVFSLFLCVDAPTGRVPGDWVRGGVWGSHLHRPLRPHGSGEGCLRGEERVLCQSHLQHLAQRPAGSGHHSTNTRVSSGLVCISLFLVLLALYLSFLLSLFFSSLTFFHL